MMDYLANTLAGFASLFPVTLAQSVVLAFVVLAIMLPFRVLNFPDLTCEGSYPFGGSVCAALIAGGMSPVESTLAAAAAGFLAGCCTAFIHLRFRIHTLLAGILMLTMLYSINLRVMGRSNVSVFGAQTLYDLIGMGQGATVEARIALAGVLLALVTFGLVAFFRTEKGVAMRAVGANPEMAQAQGISTWRATIVGVGLAGALAAIGGALMVQAQGFGDVNMGTSILINGLAALMIGEAIVGKSSVVRQLLAPLVGAFVFYQLVSLCLVAGMPPPDLKFLTGFFVLVMLALPALTKNGGGAVVRERIPG